MLRSPFNLYAGLWTILAESKNILDLGRWWDTRNCSKDGLNEKPCCPGEGADVVVSKDVLSLSLPGSQILPISMHFFIVRFLPSDLEVYKRSYRCCSINLIRLRCAAKNASASLSFFDYTSSLTSISFAYLCKVIFLRSLHFPHSFFHFRTRPLSVLL